jgi:DMSO/TMAO reductase YedYZ molybdopterin-dependent catalytic subunit
MHSHLRRRDFLRGSLAALLTACARDPMDLGEATTEPCRDLLDRGTFVGVVPFVDERDNPFGELQGAGWDARRVFDLATLDLGGLAAPADRFFVRTAFPDLLDVAEADWRVRLTGAVAAEAAWTLEELRELAVDQGEVLLECSGNSINRAFGLMSAASWTGVSMATVLDRAAPGADAVAVEVVGYDDHSTPSANDHSTPAASWIFPIALLRQGFLATGLDGGPLPRDNGWPVRLIVPGWYGCACIKWVNELRFVDDDAAATSQMQEFAVRTHQPGIPDLARDYVPATMDPTAVAVRVEQWELDGEVVHRVVGILWGGSEPVAELVLDIGNDTVPAVQCDPDTDVRTWRLWEAVWRPTRARRFTLAPRVLDDVRTVRLDTDQYHRVVEIS